MARVTVEDCVEKTPNRFELVMMAAQRSRKIGSGAALTIERDNDKTTVVSLREIAEETVSVDALKEEMISGYQRFLPQDDDDISVDLMDGEKEWENMSQDKPAKAEGMYADEEVSATSSEEDSGDTESSHSSPSLNDLAGV